MNIVAIIPEFFPEFHGGLGRYSEYYTKYLLKKIDSLHIIAFNEQCKLIPYEEKGSLKIYRPLCKFISLLYKKSKNKFIFGILQKTNGYIYQIHAFLIVCRICKKYKIDIISNHDWLNCIPGILCKLFIKVPLVFHVHSTEISMTKLTDYKGPVKMIYIIEKIAGKLTDRVIIASNQMQMLLVEHG